MSWLYNNARIIDPATNFDSAGWLTVRNSHIEDFGSGQRHDTTEFANVIDCRGMILMPGMVDIHVHFRDPGMTNAEDVQSGAKAAAAGGVTTVVCQPNTIPVLDSPVIVKYLQRISLDTCINIKMYGAVTMGQGGHELVNMPALLNAGVCGFTDDGHPVRNAGIMRQALSFSRELGMPIAQHAEDKDLSGHVNEGPVSFTLGEKGWPAIAESSVVARDIDIVRDCGGRYHVMHVSSPTTVRYVEQAKNDGIMVTCEVTPHHLFLNDSALLTCGSGAKMNPPLRSEEQRLALIEGIRTGAIDCIATDHAPHPQSSKEKTLSCSAFGVIGLETMLPLTLDLYHSGILPLIDVLRLVTINPAKIIGDSEAGRIKKGSRADLVLIDCNAEFIQTRDFYSKSINSPFIGRKMRGKVMMTICRGKIVFDRLTKS